MKKKKERRRGDQASVKCAVRDDLTIKQRPWVDKAIRAKRWTERVNQAIRFDCVVRDPLIMRCANKERRRPSDKTERSFPTWLMKTWDGRLSSSLLTFQIHVDDANNIK